MATEPGGAELRPPPSLMQREGAWISVSSKEPTEEVWCDPRFVNEETEAQRGGWLVLGHTVARAGASGLRSLSRVGLL